MGCVEGWIEHCGSHAAHRADIYAQRLKSGLPAEGNRATDGGMLRALRRRYI
jgi:hypothetical protein